MIFKDLENALPKDIVKYCIQPFLMISEQQAKSNYEAVIQEFESKMYDMRSNGYDCDFCHDMSGPFYAIDDSCCFTYCTDCAQKHNCVREYKIDFEEALKYTLLDVINKTERIPFTDDVGAVMIMINNIKINL